MKAFACQVLVKYGIFLINRCGKIWETQNKIFQGGETNADCFGSVLEEEEG